MPSFVGTTKQIIDAAYKSALELRTPTDPLGFEKSQVWTSGTGNNQCNAAFSDRRTLTATAETLDLYGGLTDAFGNTLNFVKVRELWIQNRSETATEQLLLSGTFVTGALLSGWVNDAVKIPVGPGAQMRFSNPIDGWTVTDTTQDELKVDAGADTIIYDIVILGTV